MDPSAPASETSAAPAPIPLMGVLSLVRFDLLNRLIRAIDYPVERLVVLIQGTCASKEMKNSLFGINPHVMEVIVLEANFNIGVSRGWNYILKHFLVAPVPYAIICGDDSYFRSGALSQVAKAMANDDRNNNVFLDFGLERGKTTGFISFIITRLGLEQIGLFDENIYPAYFEDNDLWQRIVVSGARSGSLHDVVVVHGDEKHTGSCTINSVVPEYRKKMDACYERNRAYIKEKWNIPDKAFRYPFNNPTLSLSQQVRHANYLENQKILLGHTDAPVITRVYPLL